VKTIFKVFANIMKSILQRVWRLNSTSLHCDGGHQGEGRKAASLPELRMLQRFLWTHSQPQVENFQYVTV
jgi:hypothetical protein